MMRISLILLAAWLYVAHASFATVGPHHKLAFRPSSTTRLHLENWVADMIDSELHRQHNKKDFESEWKRTAAPF
jgi:hypothetical protein